MLRCARTRYDVCMRGLGLLVVVLGAAAVVAACDGGSGVARDAGATVDAGPSDAALDSGADAAPFAPDPAALPVFVPCPAGWRELAPSAADEPATCEPWPASGRVVSCPVAEAHFPGEPGCRSVGDPCPAGEWPEGLPATGAIVYVRADAVGGDGTRALPFGTIVEAVAAAPAGAIVAIAKGTYSQPVRVDGSLTLWGACAAETTLAIPDTDVSMSIIVRAGTGTVVVRNLRMSGLGATLIVFDGTVSVRGLVSEGARLSGVVVYDGAIDIEDLIVRDAGLSGASMQRAGTLTLHRAVIDSSWSQALHAAGGRLEATDVAISRSVPLGDTAEAIRAWNGGSIRLERAVIEDPDSVELAAVDVGSLELREVVVRGTGGSALSVADGLTVLGASTATLERVRFEGTKGSGVYVGQTGSTASLTDVLVADVRTAPEPPLGRGVSVELGGQLTALRVLVERSVEIGVFVGEEAATADLTDVTIRDTLSTLDGLFGRGLQVQLGAHVTGTRLRVESAREAAIVAGGAGATISLRDVVIGPTLERACVTSLCPGVGGGIGAGTYLGAAVTLERFAITSSALAGVQVARGGEMDLHVGEVRGCPIGANVQVPDYDFSRLSDRVRFVDNGATLATDELPVPDVGP